MKKVVSILLSLMMLVAILHFSVAIHYCQGNVAALKVSLSGKTASCGMEDEGKDLPLSGTQLQTHCCDDVVTYFGIDSNYTPSFSFVPDFYQYNLQDFSIADRLPVISDVVLKSIYTNVSPPGTLMSTRVDLCDICIFRI